MKQFAVHTQEYENKGLEGNPRWKPAFGTTYIFKGESEQIEGLKQCINVRNPFYEVHVLDVVPFKDGDVICEAWETPTVITFDGTNYIAVKDEVAGEYSSWNSKVTRREHIYTMLPNGEIGESKLYWTFVSGNRVESDDEEAVQKELAN